MNGCFTIEELISGYFDREFSQTESVSPPHFSRRHKRRMKEILSVKTANEAGGRTFAGKAFRKPMSVRKRIIIAAVIVIFMAILTGAVSAFVSGNFGVTISGDSVYITVNLDDSCPRVIENAYYLEDLPGGYTEKRRVQGGKFGRYISYYNDEYNMISLGQFTRENFIMRFTVAKDMIKKTSVNGSDALCADLNQSNWPHSFVIWPKDGYIFILVGDYIPSGEIVEIAEECVQRWE